MIAKLNFPTVVHGHAAEAVLDFSVGLPVQAVLLVNSCARNKATPESDLDVALLLDPELPARDRAALDQAWLRYYKSHSVFRELEQQSPFAGVHLDFFDGQWTPHQWDSGGGPDAFEVEIGNRVAHSLPLFERGCAFADLQSRWLPYYGEDLRLQRLTMVGNACLLDLDRVKFAVVRRLDFYALDRLHYAFQEFIQALFISRRVYPIAYNKWIREQVEEWLGLADLYSELPLALTVRELNPSELTSKAQYILRLLETWAIPRLQTGDKAKPTF